LSPLLMNRILPAVAVVLVGLGVRAAAHHRYSDTYAEGRQVTVEGDITQMIYRNPHSFLIVTTRNGELPSERWVVELVGASRLELDGIAADTLGIGQHVIVRGAPGRIPAERRLRLHTIVRPSDGWRWTAASF
jgi:hypothetical protein